MALVIVLSSLVFMAALVIAFMSSVGTEMRTSKRYSDSVSSDLISQTAFNLAISQITEATRGYDDPARERLSPPPPDAKTLAWASQPGMIRTYNADGKPHEAFRLYSWDKLKVNGAFDAVDEAGKLKDWASDTAYFTDLNEPVDAGNGDQYPVLDPSSLGNVEGFAVGTKPTGGSANPVPMPVKWLYLLASGKAVAPVGSGKTAVIPGAGKDDPIVGRFAFWADDDTNKININTASDGTYWDTPRTSSSFDGTKLAVNQPAQKEFQRYPGHPAMTSLKTVFPNLNSEDIYTIIPRVTGGTGSSLEGTIKGSATLVADRDRLYASTDELIFTPQMTGTLRSRNDAANLTRSTLERAKFFITANNRAPELNLFNMPRIAIWPVNVNTGTSPADGAPYRTPFDSLIAFCSTMRTDLGPSSEYKFYFQREDPLSSTHDLPPGSSTSGLGRNRMLINYLKELTGREIPGFGGNMLAKYGANRDQIITEVFDYVRSVNTLDTSGAHPYTTNLNASGRPDFVSGAGQVMPIQDGDTRGFGRFPTLQGITLLFFGRDDKTTVSSMPADMIEVQCVIIPQMFDPSHGFPYVWPRYRIEFENLGALKWTGFHPVTGAALPPTKLFAAESYPNMAHTAVSWGAAIMWGNICTGGSLGGMDLAAQKTSYPYISATIRMKNPVVNGVELSTRPTFQFTGGDVIFHIEDMNSNKLQTIQVHIPDGEFPVPKLAPLVSTSFNFRRWTGGQVNGRYARTQGTNNQFETSWVRPEDVVRSIVPAGGDIRMIAGRKDIPLPPVPDPLLKDTYYAQHSKYSDPTQAWAHNLRLSSNTPYYKATGGRLLPLAYPNYALQYSSGASDMNTNFPRDSSVVPDTYTNGVALGKATPPVPGDMVGDWDNGVSFMPDGPYIGKPDEGDNATTPYFYYASSQIGASLFSPNRMMPSAGMFGSLPTGVIGNTPWRTLQFRPGPAAHPGLASPRDHLWLDLFHMPVVEPYAISEPLSSAGRINMNYQIVPFTYITRETGLRAVLAGEKVVSIPDADASVYKRYLTTNNTPHDSHPAVNVAETLHGFEAKFKGGDIFRSASEICDVNIVPMDGNATFDKMDQYWSTHRLTGDNSRERVYATLYPRLTTKSNTFTIHVRAQCLAKRRTSPPSWDTWEEGKDVVASEYRGSETVERYVDPNNTLMGDYADAGKPRLPISDFYKIRVLAAKQFAP